MGRVDRGRIEGEQRCVGLRARSLARVGERDDACIRVGEQTRQCGAIHLADRGDVVLAHPLAQVDDLARVVLELDTLALSSVYSITSPDHGGGDCYGGGGNFVDGTIEIVSIDADRVVVQLDGTNTTEFDANGEHTALRCP